LAVVIQSLADAAVPTLALDRLSRLPLHVALQPPYPSAGGSPTNALRTLLAALRPLAAQLELAQHPFRSVHLVIIVVRLYHVAIALELVVECAITLDGELAVSALDAAPLARHVRDRVIDNGRPPEA